ncbi:phage late control D family protein [Leptolyngbya sp. AN10]|uniref:phage late control D family protein n=1 Tax=Leptolyngbya sp. AN10 TaxID=3423365 RepID=UPI003D3110E2
MPQGNLNLTILIGANTPRPAPTKLTEAIDSLMIIYRDSGRSGFQIVFRVGRSTPADLQDDPLLRGSEEQLLLPFNRVIVTMTLNSQPRVLLDGIITFHEFAPSLELGESIFTITGEDVGVMMDLEEKSIEHPELNDKTIVETLITQYGKYGLVPKLSTPQWSERPLNTERVPVQLGTDLAYIQELANRHGFVFYIKPGAVTGQNIAYWGSPDRAAVPSKPLTFNMGSFTNVDTINFQYDGLAATKVVGQVQDRKTNQIQAVSQTSSQRSLFSREPALTTQSHIRTTQFRQSARLATQASAYAQAKVDQSIDRVITATGEVDTLTYGDLLQAGGTVDLRGVGYTYDGRYYVNEVTHEIRQGDYKQRFVMTREGVGTTRSSVNV